MKPTHELEQEHDHHTERARELSAVIEGLRDIPCPTPDHRRSMEAALTELAKQRNRHRQEAWIIAETLERRHRSREAVN